MRHYALTCRTSETINARFGFFSNAAHTQGINYHIPIFLGLEASEGWVIQDEELSGVGKDQTGTLGFDLFSSQFQGMGRGVVLHLLLRPKLIGSGSLLSCLLPQVEIPDDPGQSALGDVLSTGIAQNLLNLDGIASTTLQSFLDQGSQIFVAGSSWRSVLPFAPKHLRTVFRDRQKPADLSYRDALLFQAQDGMPLLENVFSVLKLNLPHR